MGGGAKPAPSMAEQRETAAIEFYVDAKTAMNDTGRQLSAKQRQIYKIMIESYEKHERLRRRAARLVEVSHMVPNMTSTGNNNQKMLKIKRQVSSEGKGFYTRENFLRSPAVTPLALRKHLSSVSLLRRRLAHLLKDGKAGI